MDRRLIGVMIVLCATLSGGARAEPQFEPEGCQVEGVVLGSGVRVAPCLDPDATWGLRSFHLARADGAGRVRAIAVEQTSGGVRFALHGGGRDGGQLTAFAEYEPVLSVTWKSRLEKHRETLRKRIQNLNAVEAALTPLAGKLAADRAAAADALRELKSQSEALRVESGTDAAAIAELEDAILTEAARVAGLELQESGVRTNLERTRALKDELGRALEATQAALADGPAPSSDGNGPGAEGRADAGLPALIASGDPALELPDPALAIFLKDCAIACEAPVAGWTGGEAFVLRGFALATEGPGGFFTNLEIRPVPARRSVIVKFGGDGETRFDARLQYALVPLEALSSAAGAGRGRNPGLAGADAGPAASYWSRMTLKTDAAAGADVALRGFALAFERRPRPLGEIGVLRLPRLGQGPGAPEQGPGYRFVLRDDEAVDPVVWAAEYAVLQ